MPPPSEGPRAGPAGPGRRRWLRDACALAAGGGWRPAAAAETIRLGQSVPVSGPAQHLGIEYQRGFQLAFDAANTAGGVQGRRIELICYDDSYEPATTQANTRDLLQADGVFALVGYVGTEGIQRSLPQALAAGVPFVAPLSGAERLRQNPSRWLFHLRPGLLAETGLIARTLATMAWQRIAVLQQDDADGEAAAAALLQSLQAAGLPAPVVQARLARNGNAQVELGARETQAAIGRLQSAQPQALVCLAAYATTAAVLRGLRERGFAGGAYATSLSSAAAIVPLLGPHAAGLSVTQVVPSPTDLSRPVVASYLQRLKPTGALPEHVSLEGWLAGQTVVEALRRMPRGGSREQFMGALESLGGHDLGGHVLRWDPQQRQACGPVTLTVLDANGRPRR